MRTKIKYTVKEGEKQEQNVQKVVVVSQGCDLNKTFECVERRKKDLKVVAWKGGQGYILTNENNKKGTKIIMDQITGRRKRNI